MCTPIVDVTYWPPDAQAVATTPRAGSEGFALRLGADGDNRPDPRLGLRRVDRVAAADADTEAARCDPCRPGVGAQVVGRAADVLDVVAGAS